MPSLQLLFGVEQNGRRWHLASHPRNSLLSKVLLESRLTTTLTIKPEDSKICCDFTIPVSAHPSSPLLNVVLLWSSDTTAFHEERIRSQSSSTKQEKNSTLALLVASNVDHVGNMHVWQQFAVLQAR
jgi:hypothetical protein